jgi:hypothetical protein
MPPPPNRSLRFPLRNLELDTILETHVGLGWCYVRARFGHWQANLVELGMPVPRNVKVFHGDLRGRAGVQSGVFQASDGKRQEIRKRHRGTFLCENIVRHIQSGGKNENNVR